QEELLTYYQERYRKLYEGKTSVTYYPESVTILSQKQIYYYVSSSLPQVTVKAVWISDNASLPGKSVKLIKIGSSMYRKAMIKRTQDDAWWVLCSKVDFKNVSTAIEPSVIRKHIRILPSGQMSVEL
ncbi:MAG: hypothetical protein SPM04_03700, partial [Lachnospira sp.]|nr:hypothetical protein [Lachnospira sp.]